MKINKEKRSKKSLIFGLLFVAVAVVAFFAGKYFFDSEKNTSKSEISEVSEQKTNYESATDDQKSAGDSAKRDFLEKTGELEKESQQTTLQENKNADLSVSSLGYSGDKLSIRIMVNGVSGVGNCHASVFNSAGEKISEQSAETQLMTSYYICKGFDFSGLNGASKIEINYSDAQGFSGKIEEKI